MAVCGWHSDPCGLVVDIYHGVADQPYAAGAAVE
jgi:hypothetical protein